MKVIAVAAALFSGVALAQVNGLGQLPQCGQFCITSMLGKAASLGCPGNLDVSCLCKNTDFRNGVHDCTVESCPAADQAAVLAFGNSICAGASGGGVTTELVPTGSATLIVSTGTDASGSPVTTTLGGVGAVGGGLVTVTETMSGMTTVFTTSISAGAGGATSSGSATGSGAAGAGSLTTITTPVSGASATGSATGSATTTGGAVGSGMSAVGSGASAVGSGASSVVGGASSAVTSATSGGMAPRATAMAGLAGAGMAVLAFL